MDAFDGDFIQRHARAVSEFCQVQVIHVVKANQYLQNTEKEEKTTGNLNEQIIYYAAFKTGIKPLDRFYHSKIIIRVTGMRLHRI